MHMNGKYVMVHYSVLHGLSHTVSTERLWNSHNYRIPCCEGMFYVIIAVSLKQKRL